MRNRTGRGTGETEGFVIEWPGQQAGVLYISGDTVYHDGIGDASVMQGLGVVAQAHFNTQLGVPRGFGDITDFVVQTREV